MYIQGLLVTHPFHTSNTPLNTEARLFMAAKWDNRGDIEVRVNPNYKD
jgi:hypothetical protein